MGEDGPDDLEPRTVLVGEKKHLVAARLELGHLITDVCQQPPRDLARTDGLEGREVNRRLVLHPVRNAAENVGAIGGDHQKGKIVLADRRLARGAIAKDRWL